MAAGGVKDHQVNKLVDNQEKAECLPEFLQAVYRRDQRTHERTLGPITPMVEMPDGAITEKEF